MNESKKDGLPRTRDRLDKRNLGCCPALTWSVRDCDPGMAVGQYSTQGKRESEKFLPRALKR